MRLPVTIHPVGTPSNTCLSSYKEWLGQQNVTANTLRVYHSRVKQFLLFMEYANLDCEPLDDLSRMNEAMALYLNFLKQSKGAARSINANVNALNNFSHFLGLKGTQLKRERCYHKPAKVLSQAEQNKFLQSVERQDSIRDKALALVLFYTGLRIGDCDRLNIEDIYLGDDSKTESTADTFAYIKLNNGARVPLNKQTVLALRRWLQQRTKLISTLPDEIVGAHCMRPRVDAIDPYDSEVSSPNQSDSVANSSDQNSDTQADRSALWLTKHGERLSISGMAFVIKRIGWQAQLVISAEILRRTWLSNTTDRFNENELASKYGSYISASAIKRHGLMLPVDSTDSTSLSA